MVSKTSRRSNEELAVQEWMGKDLMMISSLNTSSEASKKKRRRRRGSENIWESESIGGSCCPAHVLEFRGIKIEVVRERESEMKDS